MLWSWAKWLRAGFFVSRRAPSKSGKLRLHLRLETLESRNLLDSGGATGLLAGGTLVYNSANGPLLSNVSIHVLFLQDSSTSNETPAAVQTQFDTFFQDIVSDGFLATQLAQYSVNGFAVGNGSYLPGWDDINVQVTPNTTVMSHPAITDALIQSTVLQEIAAGRTAAPAANNLYFVFAPPGDAVGDSTGNSANDFLGYHDAIADASSPSGHDYYAVIPDEMQTPFNSNLTSYGLNTFQGMTAVASHELAEAVTDPNPISGWATPGGSEVADQAANQAYTLDGQEVQYLYSNALGGPSHAPLVGGNDLALEQLTPPAVNTFTGGPVATFTDNNTSLGPANFYAEVFDTGSNADWTNVSIVGSSGHFVIDATPPSLPLTNGPVGTPFNEDGLVVIVSTSPIDRTHGAPSGVPVSIRYAPYVVSATAPLNYTASSDTGTHDFVLTQVGANFQLTDNGLVVFTQPVAQTTSIRITTDPSVPGNLAANVDASLTIDYSGGVFANAVTFDGGPGSGMHMLSLENGSFNNETYTPSGPTSGTFNFDGQVITFAHVDGTAVLAAAANLLTLNGTANPDQIDVEDGPLVNNAPTTEVSSGNGTFAAVLVANNANVAVNGAGGADTIMLNDPHPETSLQMLTIDGGSTAAVICDVLANASTVTTNIVGAAAAMAIDVGNAGSLLGIQGALNFDDPAGAYDTVIVDASAETMPLAVYLIPGAIAGLPASITYNAQALLSLTFDGGSGGNTYDVEDVGNGVATILNGGSGADTFNVLPQATGTNLTINGQAPSTAPGDTLVYDDSATVNPGGPGSGTITDPGQATIAFTGIETTDLGADLALSTVAMVPGTILTGATATVTLTALDGTGTQQGTGGLTVAFGLGNGSGGGTFSAVTDNGNGTYTATFTGTTLGSNTILATVDGQPLTSSPPAIAVTQAPVFTSGTSLAAFAGHHSTFTVTTTAYPVPKLHESGPLPSGMTFLDSGNGTATLSGTPPAGTSGNFPIVLTAVNGVLPDAAQSFTLIVYNGAPTVQIVPVATSPLSVAVQSITIIFSQPVQGFSLNNLTLSRGGSANLLTPGQQTLTTTDSIHWTLGGLAGLTDPTGEVAGFTLTLSPAGISNAVGAALAAGASTSFIEMDPNLSHQGGVLTANGNNGNPTYTLALTGIDGNNNFAFSAGGSDSITIHGTPYTLDPTLVTTVNYKGNGSSDLATLTTAGSNNTATVGFGSATLAGASNSYTVNVSGVGTVIVNGGSTDTASFADASGSNTFVGTPGYSYLSNGAQISKVVGFHTVVATSTSTGADTAFLYDTTGSNTFVGTPTSSSLTIGGASPAVVKVIGYKAVQATAAAGTNDTADFNDVSGSNLFVATPTYGYLLAGNVFNEAIGFKSVVATAATGTSDNAYFYDGAGSNSFVGMPGKSYLTSGSVVNEAVGYQHAIAIAPAGDHDTATLYGAATGSNTFIGTPTYSYFISGAVLNEAIGFVAVVAQAMGGSNSASLYDAPGVVNTFVGTPTYAYLKGSSYFNEVIGFAGGVAAQGSAGSSDTAYLYGQAAGGDTFVGTAVSSYLSGSSFLNQVIGFGSVVAISQGPNDVAYLYDAASGGTFVGQGTSASLITGGGGISLSGFARVIAIGSTGPNHLFLGTINFLFADYGTWM